MPKKIRFRTREQMKELREQPSTEKLFKKQGDIRDEIDSVLSRTPLELKRVTDNLKFIDEIQKNPIPSNTKTVKVFGWETIDVNAILKNNIWNRSIFTVDKLCKLFLKMDLEQKKKYLRKKRPLGFNFLWLMFLIVGIVIFLLVVIFLLPTLGAVI